MNREKVIAAMNTMIEETELKEHRERLKAVFTMLLLECGTYKGFNYSDWLDGGYSKWLAAGRPKDTGPFFGDESKVRFY